MMLQAASRQPAGSMHHHQHQHQHQHQQYSRQHQRLPQLQSAAPHAKSTTISVDEANQSSGRLASALLFMAVLVLMVDASRIILYSWYTDGTYLKYLYGSDADIRWPKCDDDDAPEAFSGWTTPTPAGAGQVITAISLLKRRRLQQQQQPEDQFKSGLMNGLLVVGTLIDSAAVSADSPEARRRTRQLAKPLVRVLFHASTVACLFLLAVAIFPAALRSRRRGRCLLSCSLLFGLATLVVTGVSVAASLLTLFFFSVSELQPSARPLYSFVPRCDALRRAFLGAECFSLIIVCSAVCILLRLEAFFCRLLCSRCCCRCCRPGIDDVDGGHSGDLLTGGGGVGYRDDGGDFPLARRSLGRGGYPYEDEEYLA